MGQVNGYGFAAQRRINGHGVVPRSAVIGTRDNEINV